MLAESLIAAAALIALVLLWRRHRRRMPARQTGRAQHARSPDDYRCVELRPRGGACAAVKRYAGKRFLPDEAPRFPVPECTASRCSCRYLHHADRRRGERRRAYGQWVKEPPASVGVERRFKTDRRKPGDAAFRPTIQR